MEERDIEIIKQLYNCYHLEPEEIERAKYLVHKLNFYLKNQ